MNGSEHISQSDESSDIYQILNTVPRAVANGHCLFGTTLTIYRFNHSDNGYYWCQIVSNNNCPLLSSSRGYAAVGDDESCMFECQLTSPICAEGAESPTSEEMGCVSLTPTIRIMSTTIPIGPYSTHNYNNTMYSLSLSTTATSTITLHDNIDFDRDDNMVWLYGLIIVFLLVIIILVLSLVFMSIKYRIQQKRSKYNTHNNIIVNALLISILV